MHNEILNFFHRITGDACSAFVLAIALHVVANASILSPTSKQLQFVRSTSAMIGVSAFLGFCCANYAEWGPDWVAIVFISALWAWIVASVTRIVLLMFVIFNTASGLSRLRGLLARRRYRSRMTATPRHEITQQPEPVIKKEIPPPPTLEEKAAMLRTRYSRLVEEIKQMPIPEDECEARLHYAKEEFDDKLDTLLGETL
jgi:hypothetical protein